MWFTGLLRLTSRYQTLSSKCNVIMALLRACQSLVIYDDQRFARSNQITIHTSVHQASAMLNEPSTSSVCFCTDASTTKLLGTRWTTAHEYPTSPIVNGYVLQVVMKSLFHVTGSVPIDVGHLLLLARLSGTLCPRTCGIRTPEVPEDRYRQSLKTFLFAQ